MAEEVHKDAVFAAEVLILCVPEHIACLKRADKSADVFALQAFVVQACAATLHQVVHHRVVLRAVADADRLHVRHQAACQIKHGVMCAEQHDTLPVFSRFADFFKADEFSTVSQPGWRPKPGDEGFHQADAIIDKDLAYQGSLLVSGLLREADSDVHLGNTTATFCDLMQYQPDALADDQLPGVRQARQQHQQAKPGPYRPVLRVEQ